MSTAAIAALRAERTEVLRLARTLSADEWALPSDCDGWSVKDVLAHMATIFHPRPGAVLAAVRAAGDDVERVNDALVAGVAGLPPDELVDDYERWSRLAITALSLGQRWPLRDVPLEMGPLGRHPLHRFADALTFDHYTHLRCDLLAPLGPIERPHPPHDALRLGPVLEWVLGGLVAMSGPGLAEAVAAPVVLDLRGPAGGRWTYRPGRAGRAPSIVPVRALDAAATITSTTDELVIWGTRRRPWRERDVATSGDHDVAEAFLDHVNVI